MWIRLHQDDEMMAWNGMRKGVRRLALMWVLALAAGCGEDGSVLEPNPLISPLVGDWTATSMVLTSVANPEISPDIIQFGASFTLNVQASGQYTAILIYAQQAATEIGILSVSGNVVTFNRSFPDNETSTAVYTLSGSRLTLDGDTEFDFNLDQTLEAAVLHVEMERR